MHPFLLTNTVPGFLARPRAVRRQSACGAENDLGVSKNAFKRSTEKNFTAATGRIPRSWPRA